VTLDQSGAFTAASSAISTSLGLFGPQINVTLTNNATYPVRFVVMASGAIVVTSDSTNELTRAVYRHIVNTTVAGGTLKTSQATIQYSPLWIAQQLSANVAHTTEMVLPTGSVAVQLSTDAQMEQHTPPATPASTTGFVFGRYVAVRA
jgi:hypothetical protein